MMPWFSIDSVRYDMPCSIERTAEVRPSDISGMLLDKKYFNDVLGTYLKYTISIAIPKGQENDYSQLYEILTNPVASHTVNCPYNQTRKTIVGRIESVSDSYYREEDGIHIWRRTKFDIISNEPYKVNTL